jgi:hypothetical protein
MEGNCLKRKRKARQGSGRFFGKKLRKKLLPQGGAVPTTSHDPKVKSFFASFFPKKEVLS